MKGTTKQVDWPDHYLHLCLFFFCTFSSSESQNPLLFFSSAPKHPISPVRSWAVAHASPLDRKVFRRAAPGDTRWWAPCPNSGAEAVLGQPQTGCCLEVLDLGPFLGLCRWAFDGLMTPVMDLGAVWQGIIGLLPCHCNSELLCGCADGLFFHRTWHFPRILIPSVIVNEHSALLLLKQIPVKKSLCQPGQPPRYPSRVFLISQLIHYVKEMWKWFSGSCQDTVIPNWKYWRENLKKQTRSRCFCWYFYGS